QIAPMQQLGMPPMQEPQAPSGAIPQNIPDAMPAMGQDVRTLQQMAGASAAQQMSYQPNLQGYPAQYAPQTGYAQAYPQQYPQGYQQPYQQMPQAQYNPWAQQMPPQPHQQWPQSFQQQPLPMQSSQQPAAQMMYPNAANQYAQPQQNVFGAARRSGLYLLKTRVWRNRPGTSVWKLSARWSAQRLGTGRLDNQTRPEISSTEIAALR
ncbi:MAG: hypothetical protein ACLS3M_11990, partial [Collinsella sp.]